MFVRARQKLGEILSAFEFFDQQALDLTLKHLEGVRNPLPDTQTPFYLVVETSGSNEEHDNEKLQVRPALQLDPHGMHEGSCPSRGLLSQQLTVLITDAETAVGVSTCARNPTCCLH